MQVFFLTLKTIEKIAKTVAHKTYDQTSKANRKLAFLLQFIKVITFRMNFFCNSFNSEADKAYCQLFVDIRLRIEVHLLK
jgi:hypothetical protein